MQIHATRIPEVVVVEPDVFRDERGYFLESYNAKRYETAGIPARFVQDNHSFSFRGTLRGLHAQLRHPQAKLVRAVEGEVFDVAVDIRRGSPTFCQWVGVTLSASNHLQLFIPVGFAHGFCVLSDMAHFEYKVTDYYDPAGEVTILWNDPEIAIDWPLTTPFLSEKDRAGETLAEVLERLPDHEGSSALPRRSGRQS